MAISERDSVIFVVRHGDRFDREVGGWEGKARWWAHPEDTPQTTDIASHGANAHDPPLSSLGQRQAMEIGAWLAARSGSDGIPPIKKLLVSPYIRTVQTAAPLASLLSLQMLIEDGISEGTPPPQWGGWCVTPHALSSIAPLQGCFHTGARCCSWMYSELLLLPCGAVMQLSHSDSC